MFTFSRLYIRFEYDIAVELNATPQGSYAFIAGTLGARVGLTKGKKLSTAVVWLLAFISRAYAGRSIRSFAEIKSTGLILKVISRE